jgi:chromosome segregation ATPase
MRDTLQGLLELVTNPEKVAKNIKSLQEKMESCKLQLNALNTQKSLADERENSLNTKEKELTSLKNELNERKLKYEDLLNQQKNYQDKLNARASDLSLSEENHKKSLKDLETRELALKVAHTAIDKRATDLAKLHDEREYKLNKREDALTAREVRLLKGEAAFKEKTETLRKLAS